MFGFQDFGDVHWPSQLAPNDRGAGQLTANGTERRAACVKVTIAHTRNTSMTDTKTGTGFTAKVSDVGRNDTREQTDGLFS